MKLQKNVLHQFCLLKLHRCRQSENHKMNQRNGTAETFENLHNTDI